MTGVSSSWVVDPEHPQGHLVEMSDAEQAQHDQDVTEWFNVAEAERKALAAVEARRHALRDARAAIADGSLFSSLSDPERHVIDLLLETGGTA